MSDGLCFKLQFLIHVVIYTSSLSFRSSQSGRGHVEAYTPVIEADTALRTISHRLFLLADYLNLISPTRGCPVALSCIKTLNIFHDFIFQFLLRR